MNRNKILALSLGIVCHASFAVAIASMAYMIFFGLTKPILSLGIGGKTFDLLLIIQFPLLHSYFLTRQGKRLITYFLPPSLRDDLFSTIFSTTASWQLLITFLLWQPTGPIWYEPHGSSLWIWSATYAFSWILLIKSLQEAGMSLQTGSLGWIAVYKGEKPVYPKFPTTGLHGIIRHPIYVSFALIVLTAPTWSFDHFALALVWVAYCFIGPSLKEQRYMKRYPTEFVKYRERVSFLFPLKLLQKLFTREVSQV